MTSSQRAGRSGPLATIAHFSRADGGAVSIMYAFALLPTVLAIGLGIDYARATSERTMLQSGVDAAALAGIQAIRRGETVMQATPLLQQVIAANDTNASAYLSSATLSSDGTTLCVSAKSTVPTTIMAITNLSSIAIGVQACSAMQLDTYEIALAMDNSASMANSAQSGGKTKMQYAQQAAQGLISALAPNSATGFSGVPVSYAVVPFSSSVNVGAANQGSAWLDMNGQSSIHWKSFSVPATKVQGWTRPTSLFAMLSTIGISWGGCVEERPAPYTTSDDAPSSSLPDTLFAPFFSPDETDQNAFAKQTGNSSYNQLTFNNWVGDNTGICTTAANDPFAVADAQAPGRGDGQTKLCKYTSKVALLNNKYYVTGQAAGPNAGCATPAITTLTTGSTVVNNAITSMTPIGDTALAPGFMWAWRALSPKGPFASAGSSAYTDANQQKPKAYGYVDPNTTAVNHKVIILLTDGMNDWFGQDNDGYTQYTQYDPNKMVYNAFGYPQEGRLTNGNTTSTTTSTARGLLDQTTANACAAAKATKDPQGNAAPIEIFTVGFLASDGIDAAGRQVLANCATDSAHAFLATNGDQLVQQFQQIAAAITQPRIQN